jgi:hypothetical protein
MKTKIDTSRFDEDFKKKEEEFETYKNFYKVKIFNANRLVNKLCENPVFNKLFEEISFQNMYQTGLDNTITSETALIIHSIAILKTEHKNKRILAGKIFNALNNEKIRFDTTRINPSGNYYKGITRDGKIVDFKFFV